LTKTLELLGVALPTLDEEVPSSTATLELLDCASQDRQGMLSPDEQAKNAKDIVARASSFSAIFCNIAKAGPLVCV
jgi:hypothetical protein